MKVEKAKIKLDIQPGSVSPAMKMAWRVWWARLVASVHEELDGEEKSEHA